jgi:hypothetical protein
MRRLRCLVVVAALGLLAGVTAFGEDNAPPEGFQLLFNGKDLTNWKADEAQKAHWQIVDGALEYDGKAKSLVTEKDYGDFELWVDWKIHAGGDSGIYLRGKPQVQIWDKPTIGSGGLYNNKQNPRNPLVVADNPPGQWNTFKIRIVGDKVTVHLNDKLVVDNVTMENWPKYDAPLPAKGPIELQHHGSHLWFKNIYIKELESKPAQ